MFFANYLYLKTQAYQFWSKKAAIYGMNIITFNFVIYFSLVANFADHPLCETNIVQEDKNREIPM